MKGKTARYINRELSWLEFNQRVLDEAFEAESPLLERLKFLAITGSNLDEFFMVRVGGLEMLRRQRTSKRDATGMTPTQQLKAIDARIRQMNQDQYRCFLEELEPALADEGIKRARASELKEQQAESLQRVFDQEISAVLTPMAIGLDEEFPLLVNQPLNVCVRLRSDAEDEEEAPRVAVIPLGTALHRFYTLQAESGYDYLLLEDIVCWFADNFFPSDEVLECLPFRIIRNADMGVQEDGAADLLAGMQEVLDARKQSACIRLEIQGEPSRPLRKFLQDKLEIASSDVYEMPGPLDLSAFMELTSLAGYEHLRDEPWPPRRSPEVDPKESMFDRLARGDVLLYHPYESFEPVVRLVEEAADDPDVLAIKQTLYRTSRDSPIIAALKRAAERGKYVTAVVELKARFDEARNIEWARNLEQASVQVIYGVKGLKTHAKLCIIVRREPHGIVRYVHFGTGNYNEVTARIYSDVSYMSCNDDLGADASSFFNAISGNSQAQAFRKLDAAPLGLREKLLEMIDTETQRRRHGQKAHIAAKLNSLVDPAIIDALYEASIAGVKVKLNVRGICCLRPGVKGLSENIEVVSIVDRFLEHARIFYFYHGGDDRVFISSADWMPRNLDRRVELLVPVEDSTCRQRLIGLLDTHFRDNVKAHALQSDGSYRRVEKTGRRRRLRSQKAIYDAVSKAVRETEQSVPTMLEPHQAPKDD